MEQSFICIGCQHDLPLSFQMRTEGYCYMCDPDITLEELLSHKPGNITERSLFLDKVKQDLIEKMAEFLDGEELKLNEAIALLKDPVEREKSELHIRMANAAFNEYKKTILV